MQQLCLDFKEVLAKAAEVYHPKNEPEGGKNGDLTRRAVEMAQRGYQLDEASLRALNAYLRGCGLFIGGDTGRGKTFFFEKVNSNPIRRVSLLKVYYKPLDAICMELNGYANEEIVVDDIGMEPVYNNYGCKLDLLPWLIETRLELPVRTHFTTNMSGEAIRTRYGAPVVDRIRSLCVPVLFTGKSYRKARVFGTEGATGAADWRLCLERCANCSGEGCGRGVTVPPAYEVFPRPPEECPGFVARSAK